MEIRVFKHIADHISQQQLFITISDLSVKLNMPAYIVGGYVRDLILNRPTKDIDIVVVGDGIAFAGELSKQMHGKARLSVFKNFGTANIKFKNLEIEIVGARKESYSSNSRNPVVERGSLFDDISRRDFTINTLALSLNPVDFGSIHDYYNGIDHIQKQYICTPLDPLVTFSDDPLRMLRAIRFSTVLGFGLSADVFSSIQENSNRLEIISMERITDELNKIILSSKPSVGFKLLDQTGLLKIILPELLELKGTETIENKSHKDNFYHTLEVLDNVARVSDHLWLRWTAILHDIGKPATRQYFADQGWTFHGHEHVGGRMVYEIFKKLKLPLNEHMKYVKKLVYLHLRPTSLTKEEVTDSAVRRLIVDGGNDMEDLITLCKADITSKNPERVKTYLRRFENVMDKVREVEEKDKLRNWKNPITGEIIMKVFGLKPSKEIGIIKEAIKEAIMEGEIHNDFEEAYAFMLNLGEKYGFKPVHE
jgi:putative nucleotidyltransferase with HDIG domain